MGGSIAKMMGSWFNFKQEKRILLVGLDAAGKTTLLYKMKLGEQVHTIPTIGFNVETVQYKNVEFTLWDVGGQEKIRPLWQHYYANTDAVIWVVDSADRERMSESVEHLQHILSSDEMRDASLLVFANKMDLPGVMSVEEISEQLGLNKMRTRDWYIQAAVATKGEGIYEGMDWLSQSLKKKK